MKYIDFFRSTWIKDIQKVNSIKFYKGFKEWLATNKLFQLQGDQEPYLLNVFDPDIMSAIASDFENFSIASIETMDSVSLYQNKKPMVWIFMKNYYAAFYSAHALLRLTGRFFIRADQGITNNIEKSYMSSSTIKLKCKNYWSISYDKNFNEIVINNRSNTTAHEGLWKDFSNLLIHLRDESLNRGYIAISSKTEDLLDILGLETSSNYNWLSVMRNEFTYLNNHFWFPKKTVGFQYSDLEIWKKDFENIHLKNTHSNHRHLNFLIGCQAIVSLCRDSIQEIKRISTNKTFVDKVLLKFINIG
ncbi:MAG: hypothetical protein ACKO3R_01425 [bacterium]